MIPCLHCGRPIHRGVTVGFEKIWFHDYGIDTCYMSGTKAIPPSRYLDGEMKKKAESIEVDKVAKRLDRSSDGKQSGGFYNW